MNWTEIADGHWLCENGCQVVNGTNTDPCEKCKGTGRRGRGRCGECGGRGRRRRRYDTGCMVTVSCSCRLNLATVQAVQERLGDRGTVYEYTRDDDQSIDLAYYRHCTGEEMN